VPERQLNDTALREAQQILARARVLPRSDQRFIADLLKMTAGECGVRPDDFEVLAAIYLDPSAPREELAARIFAPEKKVGPRLASLSRAGYIESSDRAKCGFLPTSKGIARLRKFQNTGNASEWTRHVIQQHDSLAPDADGKHPHLAGSVR